jgi:hypothetical protein
MQSTVISVGDDDLTAGRNRRGDLLLYAGDGNERGRLRFLGAAQSPRRLP